MCSIVTSQPSAAAASAAACCISANIAASASASMWRMSIVTRVSPGTAVTTPGQHWAWPMVVTPSWRRPISLSAIAKRDAATKLSRRISIGIVPE